MGTWASRRVTGGVAEIDQQLANNFGVSAPYEHVFCIPGTLREASTNLKHTDRHRLL